MNVPSIPPTPPTPPSGGSFPTSEGERDFILQGLTKLQEEAEAAILSKNKNDAAKFFSDLEQFLNANQKAFVKFFGEPAYFEFHELASGGNITQTGNELTAFLIRYERLPNS